ncbi:DUF1615 domain-containing protein [Cognatilysobacter lacus]|uniref:DUF1615 domain-containing protein n=1 Tax=Cognatilysobacter lacus TaxID=1643323 RepID=A0A5D8Z9R4_9GAMM|nr:DUF1615 domain-containing protein [Lysobacter lacus]TZF91541.1 DUF1615 domain-containing protein [Lysobacter lacus]
MTEPALRFRLLLAGASACLLALGIVGCNERPRPHVKTPAEVRAELSRLMPSGVRDRSGWAGDIQAAFAALRIEPSTANLCAVVAVTEQESSFAGDPKVPGLGRIALEEIDRRFAAHHVPPLVARAALQITSPDGRTWEQRIAAATTERELSDIYEAMIDRVPMGRRLLASANPVHTGGPMQVSVTFAEHLAADRDYPYAVDSSIRHEVFTRRGGVYFGTAHLLGYRSSYRQPIFRFADYNAGWYASRNAAFQNAASIASGIPLDLDGDVVRYDGSEASRTEVAVRALSQEIGMDDAAIHRDLLKASTLDFEKTDLYREIFSLGEHAAGHALPRARLPEIRLSSPKITRHLTTAWFAKRVDQRYRACMARSKG